MITDDELIMLLTSNRKPYSSKTSLMKAAEKHADDVCPGENHESCVWAMSKQDFLAGVAHARKPHVVAEGDLPKDGQKVMAYAHSHEEIGIFDYQAGPDQRFIADTYFTEGDCHDYDGTRLKLTEVKYWWPLPEVEGEK